MQANEKVVVVTGGGKAIGAEYSKGLAARRYRVVVADIDEEAASRTCDKLVESGATAWPCTLDVSNRKSVEGMVQNVLSKWGRIDGLVNNAALYSVLKKGPLTELDDDEWDRVMAVNVKGVFYCIRAVTPCMASAGGGRIVNITSTTVHMGVPLYPHYVASKAAVIGLTRALAKELGDRNITVNAVAPGLTATETNRPNIAQEYFEAAAEGRCLKRVQVPEDLVGPVAFLLSDEAAFITGQTVVVDGGVVFL